MQEQTLESGTEKLPSPFVKWAGGKNSLVTSLLSYTHRQFSSYYEPFLGGGAFFFALYNQGLRFRAHLSDVNGDLINSFKVVEEEPDALIMVLLEIQEEYLRSENRASYYYGKRDWHPSSRIDSAARLIFLNKTCYNGLFRVNSRGEFNVPFGRYSRPRIVDPQNVRAVSRALRKTDAELRWSDYKNSISDCGDSDFVYLDPPYQPKNSTSSFTDYTPGGFSETNQKELAREFEGLVDRGCTVLLSNSDTPLTRRLYARFKKTAITVNRPINSVGTRRRGYNELIVLGVPK